METTGNLIKSPVNSWLTVIFMNLKTGLALENASTHGNAEVPDNAKDKDGVMEMTLVKKFMNDLYERLILLFKKQLIYFKKLKSFIYR